MRSLRRTALLWMTGLITAVGFLGAALSYGLALREANSFMDSQLRQVAMNAGPRPGVLDIPVPKHDPEDDLVVQQWPAVGETDQASPPGVPIPRQPSGFATVEVGGVRWRVFTAGDGDRTIQVSQQVEVRRELAESAALQAALPLLIVIPIGWLVVGWAMGRALQDLRRLAADIEALPAESRAPIELAGVPLEVAPIVLAMNRLIERLRWTLMQQRRFLSDAAHELRTPLTALDLQIANLGDGSAPTGLGVVNDLRQGARRAASLVGNLLRMARYDVGAEETEVLELDLKTIVLAAIADHVALADSLSVDLGVTRIDSAPIRGDERALRILFGNLIDNAVKYTTKGGIVDVDLACKEGRVDVTVCDTGPGIAASTMPRIFDRFFRAAPQGIEGSGLGLAIARAIAGQHGLTLHVDNRSDRTGLRVTVTGPTTAPVEERNVIKASRGAVMGTVWPRS